MHLSQYMAGGDLGSALSLDVEESDDGARRRLGWYDMGGKILLRIISGLADMHKLQVSMAYAATSCKINTTEV